MIRTKELLEQQHYEDLDYYIAHRITSEEKIIKENKNFKKIIRDLSNWVKS